MVDLLLRFRAAGHDVDLLVFDGADTPFKESLRQKDIRIFELGRPRSVYRPDNILRFTPYLDTYDIVHPQHRLPILRRSGWRLFGGQAKLVYGTQYGQPSPASSQDSVTSIAGCTVVMHESSASRTKPKRNLRRHASDL